MSVTPKALLTVASLWCLAGLPSTAFAAPAASCPGTRTPQEAGAKARALLAGETTAQTTLLQAAACYAADCENSTTALPELYEKNTTLPLPPGVPQCLLESCEQNAGGPACQLGARALAQGRGITADAKRASDLFIKGCDAGGADGCQNQMDFLRRTGVISVEEHGHLTACVDTIRNSALPCRELSDSLQPLVALASQTSNGDLEPRLNQLLHWGCRGQQHRLCVPYAAALAQAGNKTKALQVLTTACGLGQEDACPTLVASVGAVPSAAAIAAAAAAGTPLTEVVDEDNSLRRYLFGEYCKEASQKKFGACVDEDARWTAIVPMAEDFQKKCQDSNVRACTTAGLIRLSVEGQPRGSAAYFRRACSSGGGQGCYFLALQKEARNDLVEAGDLFQKSCDEPFGPGCTHLADYYEKGKRVVKNGPETIKALRVLACAAGDPAGCRALAAHGGSLELPK